MAKRAKKTEPSQPATGEATLKQAASQNVVAMAASLGDVFTGFGPPPMGTYKIYRQMRANPTVALARSIATAPIKTSPYSVIAEDGVQEDKIEFIQKEIDRLWPEFIRNILYSLDYGWMPFEKIWRVDENSQLTYARLKPLLVDLTQIAVDNKTGHFIGLKQGNVILGENKCFVHTHDGEAGDLYGRSRHENIRRTAYSFWKETAERTGKYTRKTSGIIPIIEYPMGRSPNKDGVMKDNFELATGILNSLGRGSGVAMPNTFSEFAGDLTRSGIDIKVLKAWHIDFLESKGIHGKAFTDMLRHWESLILRGWLIPERTAIEGQHGTKAEAQAHGTLAMLIATLFFQDVLYSVNRRLINPLLIYNFGIEAADTIRLEKASLDPALELLYREIIKAVLINPHNIDLFCLWLDIDALLDAIGLPKSQERVAIPQETPKKQSPDIEHKEEEEKPEDATAGRMTSEVMKVVKTIAGEINKTYG